MKGRPTEQLVYEFMFPKPRPQDPQNFQTFLHRHLVLEVRQEVHSFYGHLDTPEAKYPGLDYTHRIHRIRLSRWPWHRRLFRAFDALRLTHHEISNLTKWEGTRWAKERFEREQGITIRDTTADGFSEYVEPEDRPSPQSRRAGSQESEESVEAAAEEEDGNLDEEESDEELESVGVALNERLRHRVALRNLSGDISMPLDEEWETWLKNAIESGEIPHIADQIARYTGPHSPLSADEIPDFLHDIIRQGMGADSESQAQAQTPTQAQPQAPPPRDRQRQARISPASAPPTSGGRPLTAVERGGNYQPFSGHRFLRPDEDEDGTRAPRPEMRGQRTGLRLARLPQTSAVEPPPNVEA